MAPNNVLEIFFQSILRQSRRVRNLFHPGVITAGQEEPHYFIDSGYIGIADDYEKLCGLAWDFNHKTSLTEMRQINQAHTLLLGVLSNMLELNAGKRVLVEDESIDHRFGITAALIQGVSLCEKSILYGLYLQSGSLLRQEFDGLTALSEIKSNERKDGKAPNAKHAPWKGSRHYGELSALTHLSDRKILDAIVAHPTTWGGSGASTIPQYRKENAERLYAFHTAMVLEIVLELQRLYGEVYSYESDDREKEVIDVAYSILVKHKSFEHLPAT